MPDSLCTSTSACDRKQRSQESAQSSPGALMRMREVTSIRRRVKKAGFCWMASPISRALCAYRPMSHSQGPLINCTLAWTARKHILQWRSQFKVLTSPCALITALCLSCSAFSTYRAPRRFSTHRTAGNTLQDPNECHVISNSNPKCQRVCRLPSPLSPSADKSCKILRKASDTAIGELLTMNLARSASC